MQHSNVSYPVIYEYWADGYPTNIRRNGGGTLVNAGVAYINEIIESLPQKSITNQEVNHANRPVDVGSAVDPGVPVRVGAVQRGEGR